LLIILNIRSFPFHFLRLIPRGRRE
jgi:hypothetical protein